MNIFLDTNILYKDYFFLNKSNKQILKYAQLGLINLYISDIVILEMRKHYERDLISIKKEIETVSKSCKQFNIIIPSVEINIEKQLIAFDNFYKKEFNDDFIINYKNEYLPKVVEMAINNRKPFTETKSEIKDAIIWISYADYAESNNLDDCILLSANTKDFCDKKNNFKIHKDLEIYSSKFSIATSSFHFIAKYSSKVESSEHIFELFFNSLNVNKDYVKDVLDDCYSKEIKDYIREKSNRIPISSILPDLFFLDDAQSIGSNIEILECDEIESEITGCRAIIHGIMYVSCDVEVIRYNIDRDNGENNYILEGEKEFAFKAHFNFDVTENEGYDVVSDFEITDIELSSVH